MQPGLNINQTNKRGRVVPVDGVIRRPPQGTIRQQPPSGLRPKMNTTASTGPRTDTPAASSPIYKERKPWRKRLELPLLIIAGIIGGFLVQTVWFGVPVVLAYGLYALIFRVPSRTTFTLAALSLVAVSMLLLFKPDMQLASNFTTYTFLLLVIGVITLTIEGRPIRRKRRQKNRR